MPTTNKTNLDQGNKCCEMGWNEIDRPGSYLFLQSGQLFRIPQEVLSPGHSPLISIASTEQTRVARLTEDQATPISKLRAIAADHDYCVNF